MKLRIDSRLDDGAFADVWKARDELDREVAVKIVRASGAAFSSALDHAKALARANHPNVVSVLSFETVLDPDSNAEVECIVMELIRGTTLAKRLSGPRFSAPEVKTVGEGIIDGLTHIHSLGIAHGDLHEGNVMVTEGGAKIIDILYRGSLAVLSSGSRQERLKRDLINLRFLLKQIIFHSDLDAAEATEFNNLLDVNSTHKEIKDAFLRVTDPANLSDTTRILDHAFRRLTDDGFVEGDVYASALIDETPASVSLALLKKLIDSGAYDQKHRAYLKALWGRMPTYQRGQFLSYLGAALDDQLPNGRWWPLVKMLPPLRKEGWDGLPTLSRLRLEKLITRDVLAGHKDIHQVIVSASGALGTHAINLWPYFSNPEELADNIISLLRQNWYTQNYVGSHFLSILPKLAEATDKTEEMISALAVAVRNDAKIVVNKLEELPQEWVGRVRQP